jgi:type II secretory pathway pseudopilin PulG
MTPMTRRRGGFTLVEILVAMLLTIFILTIMAEAFVTGAEMFRGLKAVGDLNQSLRTATNILGSDLAADHFEGKRRLSDTKFWMAPYNGPPEQGYFYLEQNRTAAFTAFEGTDIDGVPSRRCVGDKLAFTVKARGFQPQNYFSAKVPGLTIAGKFQDPLLAAVTALGTPDGRFQAPGTYSSQWVEVCYFLAPVAGSFTANGTPLFALYRQQRLVIANNTGLNWTSAIPYFSTIPSTTPTWQQVYGSKFSVQKNPATAALPPNLQTLYFNNPADLTIPERRTTAVFPSGMVSARIGPIGNPPVSGPTFVGAVFNPITDTNGNVTGEDLLLTDVLSFEVTALQSYDPSGFYDLPSSTTPVLQPPQPASAYYPSYPSLSASAPLGPSYFDTWSSRVDDVYNYANTSTAIASPNMTMTNPNSTYGILALKITIRIWDERSQVARQVTFIQDM